MSEIPEPRPASTVVLLRDSSLGMETLLLRRNKALLFAGGFWVFPGGKLDEEDYTAAKDDVEEAARIAAAREAFEESGLRPALEDMVYLSHWTTPVVEPRRFATWFYAAPVESDDEVVIDGGEIHDSMWIPLSEALAQHEAGELGMLPPTFITISRLAAYNSVAEMVAAERNSPVPQIMPVLGDEDGQLVTMYRGDAGYESGQGSTPGARNRCILHSQRWQYYYEGVDNDIPSLLITD